MGALRVVSWNVANRVGDAARRQGDFLAALDPAPDIVMLQEVNRRSIDDLCARAGFDWLKLAVDIRHPELDDTPVRQRGSALAGRGSAPTAAGVIDDSPLPERTIHATVALDGSPMTVASYHAPPGVNWFEKKPQQAVLFSRWLARTTGPVIFGADANTPVIDHPDFEMMRTHWHSGDRHLHGAPGDDLLWGPAKLHDLRDALRRWFDEHPDQLDDVRRLRPDGPLAVSHRTGRRKLSAGTDRRFDSVWVTDHFIVDGVGYPYEESINAGSDHAAVIVDLHMEGKPVERGASGAGYRHPERT